MNKLFLKKEFEQNKRVNTLPFVSHFIPFKIDEDFVFFDKIIDKKKSSYYIDLNGIWDFKEHKGYEDISLDENLIDTIDVPSCVQLRGYDYIQYTNWLYPFPYNPPFVPSDNPIFHYRRKINITKKDYHYIINFLGVDSAFYLYINNKYVGYSLISHSTSSFDISDFIIDGDNVIDVIVLKWNASSYLEDQDKFRFSGIFRDVYILRREKDYISDFKIEPLKVENRWYIRVRNLSTNPFMCKVENIVRKIDVNDHFDFLIEHPIIWNDKNPYLYDVLLFNDKEKILQRIGLRTVKIKKSVFYINDEHIKLKGVNRNECVPKNGATVSIVETLKDIKLIKSINCNAIRTSHYPNIPEFYELCDAYGLYVVAEADLESHGAVREGYNLQYWQDFANSGIYDDAVLDREISLYERDKNRTSIIIWSLGNESNYGTMFHEGADYIHLHDSRPIHYEGLYNLVDKSDYYTDRIDIVSRMYPSIEQIQKEYLEDEKETRPLLICEYTHAMGNSCGDINDYWEVIDKTNKIIGAFVWEWCDHAVEIDGKLYYGTDFPTHHNDGHFCVDGIVSPYRQFKSSTYEVKAIYSGVRRSEYKKKSYELPQKMNDKPVICKINKKNGELIELVYNGANILKEAVRVELVRAYIDNEMFIKSDLEKLYTAKRKVVALSDSSYKVLCYSDEQEYVEYTIEYLPFNDGVDIKLSYRVLGNIKPSRVGISFPLEEMDDFVYEGYGPYESYIDKRCASSFGKYQLSAKENIGDYLRPQESGSRFGTKCIECSLFKIEGSKDFSFNVNKYNTKQLIETAHNYELEASDTTYVYLDIGMSGVGSASCGPALDDKFSLKKADEIIFRIQFK